MMQIHNLSIRIEFDEIFYTGEGISEIQNEGTLTSNGTDLIYNKLFSREKIHTWKEYSKTELDKEVDFFLDFAEDAEESKIRKWVRKNIKPTNAFEENSPFLPFEEEVVQDFAILFSPGTD